MSFSESETVVMNRFRDKCLVAGGARAGYNLRRQSIQYGMDATEAEAADAGIASLVERGVLIANEDGDRIILTQAGAEALGAEPVEDSA